MCVCVWEQSSGFLLSPNVPAVIELPQLEHLSVISDRNAEGINNSAVRVCVCVGFLGGGAQRAQRGGGRKELGTFMDLMASNASCTERISSYAVWCGSSSWLRICSDPAR